MLSGEKRVAQDKDSERGMVNFKSILALVAVMLGSKCFAIQNLELDVAELGISDAYTAKLALALPTNVDSEERLVAESDKARFVQVSKLEDGTIYPSFLKEIRRDDSGKIFLFMPGIAIVRVYTELGIYLKTIPIETAGQLPISVEMDSDGKFLLHETYSDRKFQVVDGDGRILDQFDAPEYRENGTDLILKKGKVYSRRTGSIIREVKIDPSNGFKQYVPLKVKAKHGKGGWSVSLDHGAGSNSPAIVVLPEKIQTFSFGNLFGIDHANDIYASYVKRIDRYTDREAFLKFDEAGKLAAAFNLVPDQIDFESGAFLAHSIHDGTLRVEWHTILNDPKNSMRGSPRN